MPTFFGANYGYRSGLNTGMVRHLTDLVVSIESVTSVQDGNLVVDIGGNDGTTLSKYSRNVKKILIDPTAKNWEEHIPSDVDVVSDFFTTPGQIGGTGKATIITTISMLYDLPNPVDFVQNVFEALKPGGYWITEQSDLHLMLEQNSFDTICHEHLEYYSRHSLMRLAISTGFLLIDESINDANGGSRRFIFQRPSTSSISASMVCDQFGDVLDSQRTSFLQLRDFSENLGHRLRELTTSYIVHGLGASTKGNTLLQVLGLTKSNIPYIAEINPTKFGCETPGTRIPIISESESLEKRPECYLVLPWHFRKNFEMNWSNYSKSRAIYPMPRLEVI
jgi:hypothetical protein